MMENKELENRIIDFVTDNWRDSQVQINLDKLRLLLETYYKIKKYNS